MCRCEERSAAGGHAAFFLRFDGYLARIGHSLTHVELGSPATLTLLSRPYCHLCDDMRDAVAPIAARHGARLVVQDVDADANLERRYGERVPVLMLGAPSAGIELCHYTLDLAAVERALARS